MGILGGVSSFSQPSLYQLHFDDPQRWALVLGALVLAALVWLLATSVHRVYGLHTVDCPRSGERAFVLVTTRRGAGPVAIHACSLAPGRRLTCGTPCSAQIRLA